MSCIMTDARPHLSKAELSHALRKLKGFSADLETKSGYEASAILIVEIMADPAHRSRMIFTKICQWALKTVVRWPVLPLLSFRVS